MQPDDPRLQELFAFLRIPSISTERNHREDVRHCAQWLIDKFQTLQFDTQLLETPGHPVVVAGRRNHPDRPTVMIYGHYDVQPVDPLDEWRSPPFEPTLVGERIVARGSTDNKGQILAHILGVEQTLREKGELPLNVLFVIEGEEEIGSPHLADILRQHSDQWRVDVVAISDTGMVGPDIPTLTYGLRGIACLECHLRGPSTDLHSGIFGGAIPNPARAVGILAASLHDAQGRVAIPGFYDQVIDLEAWEREAWAQLPLDDHSLATLAGVSSLDGEQGYTGIERCWARPTAEINGIGGGYQGPGVKTVLPAEAKLKISFRLVPSQDPDAILTNAEEHLRAHTPTGIELKMTRGHTGSAYVGQPRGKWGRAAHRALEQTFHAPVAAIREGGSIPIVADFSTILGCETLLLGLALPDAGAHAPNENFPLANFEKGIALNQHLLDALAEVKV